MSKGKKVEFMHTPEVLEAIDRLVQAVDRAVVAAGGALNHLAFGVHTTIGQASFNGGLCECKSCRETVAKIIGAQLGFKTAAISVSSGDDDESIGAAVMAELDDDIASAADAAGSVH